MLPGHFLVIQWKSHLVLYRELLHKLSPQFLKHRCLDSSSNLLMATITLMRECKARNVLRSFTSVKVVALGNFKYFGIYFKMGYYLRISANKFEYLSVTRIGTWLFYPNIVVALYLLIINLLPCPLGPINLKNLIFCGREIKILSLFLRILQTLTLWIITSLQSAKEAIFKNLSWNFQFLPKIDGSRGIWITT